MRDSENPAAATSSNSFMFGRCGYSPPRPVGRCIGSCVVFSLLALLGNFLSLSIGFNVDLIFGSVFGLMAVVLLGPIQGTIVSCIGASYTYLLWNHPYAIIIFGLEAMWLGVLKRRYPHLPIAIVDFAFWVFAGSPLVFLFYHAAMDMNYWSTGIIMMKQALNGVSNAILASVIITYLPNWKWLQLPARPMQHFSQMVSESMAFLLMIACIGGLMYMNGRDTEKAKENLARRVAVARAETGWFVSGWLSNHLIAPQFLAEEGTAQGFEYTDSLQKHVKNIHTLFPDFHNLFIGDAAATTVAFDPPINEKGESTIGINFADREWFHRLKRTRKSSVSDVFLGRGGVFEPIVTIAVPAIEKGKLVGFGLGAVNLGRLKRLLVEMGEGSGLHFTVVDRKNNLILSTDEARNAMTSFKLTPFDKTSFVPDVFIHVPADGKDLPFVKRWQTAAFYSTRVMSLSGWTIIVEGPLAPLQEQLYQSTVFNIGVIFLLLIATNVLLVWLTSRLSKPLIQIAALSADIPGKIEAGTSIEWPQTDIHETAALVTNFKNTANELRENIRALKEYGTNLETQVDKRTHELSESEDHLKEAQRMAHIGSWDLDIASDKMDFSEEVFRIFEIPKERFRHTPDVFMEVTHPEDQEDFGEKFISSMFTREPYSIKHRILMADDRVKWIHTRGITHFNEDGAAVRSVGTVQDITEQVRYEERLAAYAASQQELLKEVNHRVKNNLALITGMLHLESKVHANDDYFSPIEKIAGRVNALSKLHSILSSVEWKPVSLRELCLEIIQSAFMGMKSVHVEMLPSTVLIPSSSAHNIALVINELATNSVKHTGDVQHITVTVSVTEEDEDIELLYNDDGPGYPQTLDSDSQLGFGSGLQLIKGIVEMSLYGNVWFSGDNGATTIIRFKKVLEKDD